MDNITLTIILSIELINSKQDNINKIQITIEVINEIKVGKMRAIEIKYFIKYLKVNKRIKLINSKATKIMGNLINRDNIEKIMLILEIYIDNSNKE